MVTTEDIIDEINEVRELVDNMRVEMDSAKEFLEYLAAKIEGNDANQESKTT